MSKITIKDIPYFLPEITIKCSNLECKKELHIKTANIISNNEITCPYCHCKINIKNNFNQIVDDLNKMGIVKK